MSSGQLKQLLSFKALTLGSGVSTTNGADFEANATWSGGSFSGPSVVIGSRATVIVSASVTMTGSVTLINGGTLQMANGSLSLGAGKFTNLAGGTVTTTGTSTQSSVTALSGAQLENDGVVVSQNGVLVWAGWATSPPVSSGSFGGGNGHVELAGYVNVSGQAVLGNNVWVNGTLSGTITVPAGATLNLGYDPSYGSQGASTIAGPVGGAGTLNAAGSYWYGNTYLATVAGDLNVANVTLGNYVTFSPKAGGLATVIGNQTVVTVGTTPGMASGLSLVNNGTLDFRSNDYFTCAPPTPPTESRWGTGTAG